MTNRKRRIDLYSFYDHTGIKSHLEKMARKGWMIESISNFGWKYHKIQPADLTFSVSYCSKISDFDPEPSPAQLNFLDFCAHTGWHPACTWSQMQIFYNEQKDPVPIETEPLLELEAIHKAVKVSFLPAYIILFVLAIIELIALIFHLSNDPLGFLSSTSLLCAGFAWIMLLLLCSLEIAGYFRWYSQAKKAVEYGEFLNVRKRLWLSQIIAAATAVDVFCWIISLFTAKDRLLLWTGSAVICYLAILFPLVTVFRQFLKKKKIHRIINWAATTLFSIFLTFAFTGGIVFLAISDIFPDVESLRQYKYPFPLKLEDLDTSTFDLYIIEKRGSSSMILETATFRQYPDPWVSHDPNKKELSYAIINVRFPGLYDFCKKALLLQKDESSDFDIQEGYKDVYQKQESSFWKACEVYRLVNQNTGPYNCYLLCYTDRFVVIRFSWKPTNAQLATAAEKLL